MKLWKQKKKLKKEIKVEVAAMLNPTTIKPNKNVLKRWCTHIGQNALKINNKKIKTKGS